MAHLIYFTHFTRKTEGKKREGSWERWKRGIGRKMGNGGKGKEGKRKEGSGEGDKEKEEGNKINDEVEMLLSHDLKSLSDAIARIQ